MGKTTTFEGRIRTKNGRKASSIASTVHSVRFTFDSAVTSQTAVRIGSSATAGPTLTLPKGAMVLRLHKLTASTGGSSPTFSLGITGVNGHFFTDIDADAAVAAGTLNQSMNGAGHLAELVAGTGLASDSVVYAIEGSGTQGTGLITCVLEYTIADDGKADSAV